MTKKFTVEEFRNYLQSQDSFGDALYNLTNSNIEKANQNNDDSYEFQEGDKVRYIKIGYKDRIFDTKYYFQIGTVLEYDDDTEKDYNLRVRFYDGYESTFLHGSFKLVEGEE